METGRTNPKKENPLFLQSGKEKKKEKGKYYGKFLIFIIFVILTLEYYQYVFEVMLKYMTAKNFNLILTLLIIFHVLLLLLLMAFTSTMMTNPGEIPLYWGFYIGDDDNKRKRYCLICNAFKPERSHHCSVCNVCVLNMDHHCPWVDNCIGFYNRKHFMQLLIFVVILTIYVDISEIYFVVDMCLKLFKKHVKFSEIFHLGLVIICYLAVLIFSFVITMFLKFHLNLVLNNSTTIESLDNDHKKENEKFNIGKKENWEQVFGTEPLLWFFPFPTKSGKPEGDGLTWKTLDNLNDTNLKLNDSNNKNFINSNYDTNFNTNNAGQQGIQK
jgi:palmitoyltransferase